MEEIIDEDIKELARLFQEKSELLKNIEESIGKGKPREKKALEKRLKQTIKNILQQLKILKIRATSF